MGLFTNVLRKETTTEKIRRLNFQRQKEVQKWEKDSPDSIHRFIKNSRRYARWLPLDQNSRFLNHRPPKWVIEVATELSATASEYDLSYPGGAIFLHRRFITYKVDYNDYEGIIIFKGIKPSSITRIDTQLQQLHKKTGE